MESKKPKNIDEYVIWVKEKLNVDISRRNEILYNTVSFDVRESFEKSKFWIDILKNLEEYKDTYYSVKKYELFTSGFIPELDIKKYNNFLEKTFRKNILERDNWTEELKNGWILPNNWFTRINDMVRTEFIVKYLDGVEFLKDKIKNLCEKHKQTCDISYEARWEGYYAVHLITKQKFEIQKINFDTEIIEIPIEIQITTQLQDVIRKLLHKYYEERRLKSEKDKTIWQWDYTSDEFSTNYLGHILHYLEGMIMEVREKQKEIIK